MLSYTFVDAFTRRDRRDTIARVKSAIAEADGVIVDFAFYRSAIRLSVEPSASASATSLVVAMLHVTLANEVAA